MQIIDWSLGRGEEPSGKDHAMQTADASPGGGEEGSGPRAAVLQRWRFSERGLETSSISITGSLLETEALQRAPDLLHQKLHFNQAPG